MTESTAPRLRLVKGRSKRSVVELTGRVIVGRVGTVDVPITDKKASREHARVFEQGGDWHVVDLNSTNGTLVNGSKIRRRALRNGDEITIGETVFVFELPEPPSPPEPAAPVRPPEPAVAVRPRAEPEAPPVSPAGAPGMGDIVVKQRSLHFHRVEGGKTVNPLKQDLSQRGGLYRLIIILVLLLVAIGLFVLAIWLGRSLVAGDDDEPYEPLPYEDTVR